MKHIEPVRPRRTVLRQPAALPAAVALAMLAVSTAHAESVTPKRDLAAEAAEVALGTAAYVHTDYSAGAGMLLPDRTEVLVARHIVLAPDGTVAAQIGVGLPRAPLNNIVEVPTTVEAQDPSLDLVLLRVPDAAGIGAASGSTNGSLKPCGEAAAVAMVPKGNRRVKRQRAVVQQTRLVRRTGAGNPRPAILAQPPAAEAQLRIVVDGPGTP